MAGAISLNIERTSDEAVEGIGYPIEWNISGVNSIMLNGDGYATERNQSSDGNDTMVLMLRILSAGVDEAYIQITQYTGASSYYPS